VNLNSSLSIIHLQKEKYYQDLHLLLAFIPHSSKTNPNSRPRQGQVPTLSPRTP